MVFIVCSMEPLLLCTFVNCCAVLCGVLCSSMVGYFVCCDLLYYHCHQVKFHLQSNNNNNNLETTTAANSFKHRKKWWYGGSFFFFFISGKRRLRKITSTHSSLFLFLDRKFDIISKGSETHFFLVTGGTDSTYSLCPATPAVLLSLSLVCLLQLFFRLMLIIISLWLWTLYDSSSCWKQKIH
jgi:hypothetical protein